MELPVRTILALVPWSSWSSMEALKEIYMKGESSLLRYHRVWEAALEEIIVFGCQLLHDVRQTQSFSFCQISHPG